MTNERPWYGEIFGRVPLVFLLLGTLLLLTASGVVKFGGFELIPSQNSPDSVRLVLVTSGAALVFAGITLSLNEKGIWKRQVGWLYFFLSIAITGSINVLNINVKQKSAGTPSVTKEWDASLSGFTTLITLSNLQKYQKNYKMLLVCRKRSNTTPFRSDFRIEKSELFDIVSGKELEHIHIDFSKEFSDSLSATDSVQCALSLLPRSISRERIAKLADIEHRSGIVLTAVSDDVK